MLCIHFIPNNKILIDNIIISGNIIMVDYFLLISILF